MRIPLFKRIIITALNILFPPLAVALITGWGSSDTLLNCCLFLLAIIPSHIHGFYVSAVYFTRKRRVRRGKWPGKPHKVGIWSERVLTGGVGWEQAESMKPPSKRERRKLDRETWSNESDFDPRRLSKRSSGRVSRRSRYGVDGQKIGYDAESPIVQTSRGWGGR